MPEYALWTLVISLTIYSLGLTHKITSLSHRLKLVNDEINRFIEQISILKQDQYKTISGLSELHKAETKKIIKNILDKYHRLVPPAKLAFLEQWDSKNPTPEGPALT